MIKNPLNIIKILFIFFFMLGGCAPRSHQQPRQKDIPIVQKNQVPLKKPYPTKPQIAFEENIPQKKTKPFLIVIDAGHGGEDFGTYSSKAPKYQEKSLNLSTAFLLNDYLKKMGFQTLMTRKDDTFIGLDNRAEFANGKNPDLFISVHFNSAPSKEAKGVEVYYYNSPEDKKRTQESRLLAKSVLAKVIENTEAKSRGVKHGNFAVIRKTNMPAILIEGGFLTNEEEVHMLKKGSYLKQIAWGIAEGAKEYLSKQAK